METKAIGGRAPVAVAAIKNLKEKKMKLAEEEKRTGAGWWSPIDVW